MDAQHLSMLLLPSCICRSIAALWLTCSACACPCLQGKRMHLATLWLGICGLALMAMLMARHVKGAIMAGELQAPRRQHTGLAAQRC